MTVTDLLESVRSSRRYFLRHLDGMTDTQWNWKPYPECKNVRETLAHLVQDDRAALEALHTGKEPDYAGAAEPERDANRLRVLLAESHEALCAAILERYADSPLEDAICIWGAPMTLGRGIPYLCSEDFFHAGQVAFIRQATDPAWEYYGAIYGG